jgi:hypothetical protein
VNDVQKKLIAEAKERADKATAGPWRQGDTDDNDLGDADCAYFPNGQWIGGPLECEEDAAFIANARQDIPALIAIIEEQEAAHAKEQISWRDALCAILKEQEAAHQTERKLWQTLMLELDERKRNPLLNSIAIRESNMAIREAMQALHALGAFPILPEVSSSE